MALYENLTNPALLFFLLGIFASQIKSDLEIPKNSSRFISIYLLFSIGFKGGQEIAHASFDISILWVVLYGIGSALVIPLATFPLLTRRFEKQTAAAIAAAYGSVSAVTFIACVAFLENSKIEFSGHMIAIMALMEAPAIVAGVFLLSRYSDNQVKTSTGKVLHHSFANGSVLMILGSLVIGYCASEKQAQGIAPFTTDIFKGFLALFLLDMGLTAGKKIKDLVKNGFAPFLFAIAVPLVAGSLTALVTVFFVEKAGDRVLLAILTGSASYIAVPAAMKIAAPDANPGLYIPMPLAITFPLNLTIGIPLYSILATL